MTSASSRKGMQIMRHAAGFLDPNRNLHLEWLFLAYLGRICLGKCDGTDPKKRSSGIMRDIRVVPRMAYDYVFVSVGLHACQIILGS